MREEREGDGLLKKTKWVRLFVSWDWEQREDNGAMGIHFFQSCWINLHSLCHHWLHLAVVTQRVVTETETAATQEENEEEQQQQTEERGWGRGRGRGE
jgi:hypothetical protein